MKGKNKYGLRLAAVWILAAVAAFLRRGLYMQAVDVKGLLVRNHPLALLLWAVVALGAALILLTVRKLDGSNVYEDNFRAELPAGYLLLAFVIGTMVLGNAFEDGTRLAQLLRILGGLCVPCLIWGGISRFRGRKPSFLVHVVLCLFFLLHTVSRYQLWSGNPQIQDYVFDLLASLALILMSYQCAAFESGTGSRRLQLAAGLLAILFCGAALGRTEESELYTAAMIWAANDLCRLTPPPKKDEVDSHDPS